MTLVLLAALALQDPAVTDKPDPALKAAFDAIEKAIRDGEEKRFQAQWRPEGYEKNLVGGSGIEGGAVFSQGSRKQWFPKPDLSRAQVMGDGAAVIVPCDIWSWEKEKALDRVSLLLVKTEIEVEKEKKTVYQFLGGGEKAAEVKALADRFLKKEALEPPAEKE